MIVDPTSPIARHVKWKMARTKRYGQMTSTATHKQKGRDKNTQFPLKKHYPRENPIDP